MITNQIKILDAHTHFFSYEWFLHFYRLTRGRLSDARGVAEVARRLGWDAPPKAPGALGKQWVQELDSHGIERQVLFASKLNDAEHLAAAVRAFPSRLIGYVMIDPTQETARDQAYYSLNILHLRGITLFPAMHHFHASDAQVYTVYREAASAEVPVFVHFGQLRIPVFMKLGIPENIDLTFSNPLDLKKPASDFPDVNFIIPHFGCGYFEEALAVAKDFKNVYFDTASSNSWIQPPLTLKEVFRRSLEVLGPQRILFGSDSSCFPRGWRRDILDQQSQILDALQVPEKDQQLIFGRNLLSILHLA